MKILLITVAGTSSRFRKSLGKDCLKCIFHEGSIKDSLLYRQISSVNADRYVIVGGYRYNELSSVLGDEAFDGYRDRISMVFNDRYDDYGSGYSLFVGLKECLKYDCDSITFMEGDLFLDAKDMNDVFSADHDVITNNSEPITADTSVLFYKRTDDTVRYLYDTNHRELSITEPFKAIYNSGQVWKFNNMDKLRVVVEGSGDRDWKGTNLEIISRYFDGPISSENIMKLSTWINCNTVEDYQRAMEMVR